MKFRNDEKIYSFWYKHDRKIKFTTTLLVFIVIILSVLEIISIVQKNVYNLNSLANVVFSVVCLVGIVYLYNKAYPRNRK